MNMMHSTLAHSRWFQFTLAQQFANIGSEIHRLVSSDKKHDRIRFEAAFDRALELIDLTLADPRWKTGYKEIARVREILCGLYFGQNEYDTSLETLDDYFFRFALVVQSNK